MPQPQTTMLTKEHLLAGKSFWFVDKYKCKTILRVSFPKFKNIVGQLLYVNNNAVGNVNQITNFSFTYTILILDKVIHGRIMFTDCRIKD